MFLEDEVKDVAGLARMIDQLPSLENLRRDLKAGKLDLEGKILQLIVWILRGGTSNLKLRTLSEAERLKVSDCEGFIQEFGDASFEHCEATELLRVQRLPLYDLRADCYVYLLI